MCYADGARELTRRRLRKKHEKNEPGTETMHPLDGMTVWMSDLDLTPDDDFI